MLCVCVLFLIYVFCLDVGSIEYGDMQLIAEVYDVLKQVAGLTNEELSQVGVSVGYFGCIIGVFSMITPIYVLYRRLLLGIERLSWRAILWTLLPSLSIPKMIFRQMAQTRISLTRYWTRPA